MFDNSLRKLRFLEQDIVSGGGKYVDKFEALSMAAIEIDENVKGAKNIPDMKKLKNMSGELGHALNESYIELQTILSKVQTELLDGTRSCHTLDAQLSNCDTSSANSAKSNLFEKQMKLILNQQYNDVMAVIDKKAEILRIIQKICNSYITTMTAMADDNGVLQASKKVELVTSPQFKNILENRFFSSNEEEEILKSIRNSWAGLVFHSPEQILLADRQLATENFAQNANNDQWRYHMKIGGTIVLLMWAASECLNNETYRRDVWNDQTFLIFVCLGDLLLLLMMWGVSMHVWRAAGIDFVKLLELEHTEVASEPAPDKNVYTSSSNICIAFLLAFILFNKAVRGGYFGHGNDLTFAHAIPASLVLFCALRMLTPFESRKHWLHMLWRVLAAPSYSVNFRDGYVGDLLTSLVRVFIPMCFSAVYVTETVYAWLSNNMSLTTARSGSWWTEAVYYKLGLVPFLTLLPLWLRLMQCLRRSVETGKRWPHMGNALKYTSAIVVISYGTFQPAVRRNPLWIASFVFATLIQFAWDLTQDWGMIVFQPSRHAIPVSTSSGIGCVDYLVNGSLSFRKTRLLGPMRVYVGVILFNLALRFAWTLTLLPAPEQEEAGQHSVYASLLTHLGPVLASAEIVRRMVWGFFRLEHEQLEVLSRNKAKKLLESPDVDDFGSLDKMDVSNAMEMQPMGTCVGTGSVSSGETCWTEVSWVEWLPAYVEDSIASTSALRSVGNMTSKVRLIESILFASLVIFIVFQAALPAFN